MNLSPEHRRIVITGGPKAGKTTLATSLVREKAVEGDRLFALGHTDDLIGSKGWSDASEHVATWFDGEGPWIIEGVACARALRKWLAAHPEGKPCDLVIHMTHPQRPLSPRQEGMRKAHETVLLEIEPELKARGVAFTRGY